MCLLRRSGAPGVERPGAGRLRLEQHEELALRRGSGDLVERRYLPVRWASRRYFAMPVRQERHGEASVCRDGLLIGCSLRQCVGGEEVV
jgi:hypothetical protein